MIFIFSGYPDSEIKLTGRVPTNLDLYTAGADFNHKLCYIFPVLMDVVFELMTARTSKLESLPSYINTPALIKDLISKEGRPGCFFIRPFEDIIVFRYENVRSFKVCTEKYMFTNKYGALSCQCFGIDLI